MAQQTAVEWLISELQIRLLKIKSEPNGIVRETMINNFLIDTEQSKQMEKEQIMKSYVEGINLVPCDLNSTDELDAEKYYNETYGNEGI